MVRFLRGDGAEGWGECAALSEPTYSGEYAAGAHHVIEHHLLPRVSAAIASSTQRRAPEATAIAGILSGVKGHPMAKAAVEMAVLDAELRASGTSLAARLGGVRTAVDAGVSVGIHERVNDLIEAVHGYLAQGYRRIKVKIEPGRDIEPVAALRASIGDDVLLQVDANGAYRVEDADHLARLDDLGLALIEQPLPADDLAGHAALARRLRTPICLDESIGSFGDTVRALDAGACSVVNLKPGRVGGLLEAVRIHDLCLEREVPVWCGGMLETGLGRAANVALASLPGFTLPGDLSASDRWFAQDLTEPFVLEDGRLRVPEGPGLGVSPIPSVLESRTATVTLVQ